eukprot:scaffold291491_cov18-Prasinocladus_malaysianus.AAC.1
MCSSVNPPNLQDRGYAVKEGRALVPSSLGRVLSAFLAIYFEKYVDTGFTALLEVRSPSHSKVLDGCKTSQINRSAIRKI